MLPVPCDACASAYCRSVAARLDKRRGAMTRFFVPRLIPIETSETVANMTFGTRSCRHYSCRSGLEPREGSKASFPAECFNAPDRGLRCRVKPSLSPMISTRG